MWKEEIREIDREKKRREEEKRSVKITRKWGEKVENMEKGRGRRRKTKEKGEGRIVFVKLA